MNVKENERQADKQEIRRETREKRKKETNV